MNELALTGISLVVFVLAVLGSVGVIASRRAAAVEPEPEPEPQRAKRLCKPRRTQEERAAERALVLAGLLAGIEPALIARCLKHSPAHNRRIVATVRRLNQHRLEPLHDPTAREQTSTHPAPQGQRLANAT